MMHWWSISTTYEWISNMREVTSHLTSIFLPSRNDCDLSVEIIAINIVYEAKNNKPNYLQLPTVDFLCQHSASSEWFSHGLTVLIPTKFHHSQPKIGAVNTVSPGRPDPGKILIQPVEIQAQIDNWGTRLCGRRRSQRRDECRRVGHIFPVLYGTRHAYSCHRAVIDLQY